jgi:hypothetical protein
MQGSDTAPSGMAPNSPRASPVPSDAAAWRGRTSRGHSWLSPLSPAAAPFCRGRQYARRGVIPTRTPSHVTTDAPCRCRTGDPALAVSRDPKPRIHPDCTRQGTPLLESEAPSAEGSSAAPFSLSQERDLKGRHWSRGFAAAVQLPTCVHLHRCKLGPRANGYSPRLLGPHVAHRLLQLC